MVGKIKDIHSFILNTAQGEIKFVKEFQPLDINLKVPNDGCRYVQILHDWEVLENGLPRQFQESGKPKYPYPAVVSKSWGLLTKYQDRVYDYVEVPESWQFFFWDLWDWASGYKLPRGKIENYYKKPNNPNGNFAKVTEGSLMWVYVNMIEDARSHTDSYSPEFGAKDVVTQRNMSNPKNWQWLNRPNTGQLGRIIRDWGSEWELEALDITKDPPPISYVVERPYLYGWATEITTVKLPDGRYVVSDYAQIDQALKVHNKNNPRTGTPIPFISKGGSIRIKKRACSKILVGGQSYSYYVPEK